MKISLLLLLMITWCLIDDTEGWGRRRWRVRIRFKRILKPICSTFCSIRCPIVCVLRVCAPKCFKSCKNFCGRKRSKDFRSFSLPCDFPAWDKNGDGYVNKQEFSTVADFAVEKGELALAFQATDTDGNQKISDGELHKATYLFEKC